MERLINDQVAKQVRDVFDGLSGLVEILFFEKAGCEVCPDTRQLLEEVADLSDKLTLQVFNLEQDPETARQYGVREAPAIVLAGRNETQVYDYGVRFLGIPAGHEFTSLIHDLVLVSKRDSGLSQSTRDFLKTLTQPVLLQVFTTPT